MSDQVYACCERNCTKYPRVDYDHCHVHPQILYLIWSSPTLKPERWEASPKHQVQLKG